MPKKRKTPGDKKTANVVPKTVNTIEIQVQSEIRPPSTSSKAWKKQTKELTLKQLSTKNIYTATNFFSVQECDSWIKYAEAVGFAVTNQEQTSEYAVRKQHRLGFTDAKVAASIFTRIALMLPPSLRSLKGRKAVSCLDNIRLYKYEPGHCFGRHIDESNQVTSDTRTLVTVLIYLSGELQGGETVFYTHHFGNRIECSVSPAVGLICLHEHGENCLTHEAKPVLKGCKYILRTDIVYKG